ncbi:MAG: hypothetical protein UU54_C0006G0009 [Candidatus Yanofskybacteria bacterium GW2011_GWA2_41_22]|uniref:Uncharacterized protein n=4 Tax=Candidatus Yanofskyibacteriota TaxID=1752733 RepID=A0A1F8HVS6_9BACT|nr:MAG: hypothetical protein UU54_C0006G0009 [Candidatus Yanofskybacteria bacterium GW2011_GWA2_41_22]KKS27000.1 MAG: hypothetical protein UU84_C0012G0015 [Candidatus Yanofskybacteria bacterium GW2011_GWC2_41_9]OGN00203.1 MAG: hypothetical protein A2736_02550 [Candidatus Yanofskybacteria bacterium RIFCSPHIGHO2_01_FULL_41_27]OGN20847.1 MAG: hypothetical protein A3B00_01530 [Candidatus Yanofskybacteria bacterium RIFCSPLOWO2_01_FULL_41_33]OGN41661.1 MAG: hypothetical protein A2606_01060 [Candidatu
MRKSEEKGFTLVQILIVSCSICILWLVLNVAVAVVDKRDNTKYLKQYFNIELPQGGFSWVEGDLLEPAVEKRVEELDENYANARKAETVVMNKSSVLAVADANKYLQDFRKAQNEAASAYWDLKKACEAAKYFKLVPDDCEPCKAVK